jgi:hypothetical protein
MTLPPSKEVTLINQLISSLEDFLAKISASQDAVKAWRESEADFSSKCVAWSKKSSPHSSFLKTCQPLGLEVFEKSSVNLQIWGMTVAGRVYLPRKLEPLTLEKGGSCWPTPVANDDNKSPEAHMAMKKRMKGGPRNNITSLQVMVKAMQKGVYREMWPTPKASEIDEPYEQWLPKTKTNPSNLAVAVHKGTASYQDGMRLSPMFVEWLMGFPIDWTELNALGMEWCPLKQKKLLKNC